MTVCFRIAVFLIYFIMCTSAGSNLRQVGDADYLTVPVAHFLHHVRHAVGYLTGDAGIYFIKYDSRQFHGSGNQCFDRKHDTGNFTSRSYGRGKTTIARLVPRFWEATEGKVLIGGINVREIAPEELMKYISFVFQNTKLFKTSLLENIKYGNPDATMEEVERAVDMAQCREIINKLPLGLNTKIGTEGTYLSGGEQQRIVLARAILKNAPIIVLDEATAFADPENEHLIQQALKELTKGKTVLMIAHRLSSITDADNILVIDKGKIAEQGTHANLLGKQGIYYHMWNEYQQSVRWTIGKEVSND